jgi:uncharacterized protein YajQ (UPF0234 family)
MPSLDIVSEFDKQEVDNAVNQAKKEVSGRFDFRNSKAVIELEDTAIVFRAEDEYKVGAIKDILQTKLHRRGIDIRVLKFDDVEPIGGSMLQQRASIQSGIEKEISKKIAKTIADAKLKVQVQTQGDQMRVTSKSIDALQEVIQICKSKEFGIPLQFVNMRS